MAMALRFRDSQQAFNDALACGRLSVEPTSPVYAGDYMYMGTEGALDLFKHRDTREYLRTSAYRGSSTHLTWAE